MKRRCNNSSSQEYKYYGAKGIRICDDWNNNFISFMNWAYSNGYNDNLTIERIDYNKDYTLLTYILFFFTFVITYLLLLFRC